MKHKGINDTQAPIYLVEAVIVTGQRRDRLYGMVPTFSTVAESYTDRDEALDALTAAIAKAADDERSTTVALKIKRPGSKSFVARKPGE